jgi:hypothetical protein
MKIIRNDKCIQIECETYLETVQFYAVVFALATFTPSFLPSGPLVGGSLERLDTLVTEAQELRLIRQRLDEQQEVSEHDKIQPV